MIDFVEHVWIDFAKDQIFFHAALSRWRNRFHRRPRGVKDKESGLGKLFILQLQRKSQGKVSSGRIAKDDDALGIAAAFEE